VSQKIVNLASYAYL